MTVFEVEHQDSDDPQIVVLALAGELDLTNAGALEERVEQAVSTNGVRLVLDLRRVAFIDSAALHVLFRGARGLSKERFGLVIEPASAISRTFEIVGLDAVATVGGSVHDVMATLSSG